ncbi:MAG: MBL fold metallo-hydrolase [Ruminococcus sp.]|nr:MBL fold metallo-hydrolase [Ruminococcus sp.]
MLATVGILSVAFLYRAAGCYIDMTGIPGLESPSPAVSTDGGMTAVHFLDVGQGDSTLICGTEKTVLIDGGERDQGDVVLADLKEFGVKTIDCIIATHPHSDHIGGLVDVLEYAAEYDDLEIKQVIIPDIPENDIPTTAVYANFLNGVEANGLSVTFAEYQMTLDLGSSMMTIYPPVPGADYSSLNDYSVCANLVCGDVSFFFTGDMEHPEEYDLLEGGFLSGVEATVLKAGHHGSSTSSSEELLAQLKPEYVVISCGAGNKYGHPNTEALERFYQYTDEIYRTDLDGIITCTTDGTNVAWTTEGEE